MKLLTIIGTRPEAVKMAPVLAALAERREVRSLICATGQHRQLFDEAAAATGLQPDFSLGLMQPDQQPGELQARAIPAIDRLLVAERPDRVIVHGDTGSAMAAAEAAHARGIPVSHVEAGLRTHRLDNPWPEEGYRRAIDSLADQLFAPTPVAARHLAEEQVAGRIFVTGNSGVDALQAMLRSLAVDRDLARRCDAALPRVPSGRPIILVTLHRRESIGPPLRRMCEGLRRLAAAGMHLVVTLHPNPAVRRQLEEGLGSERGIHMIEPLPHPAMIRMMQRADLIITDSGGVQEEAPSLGTPVLVAREVTERPEGVALGLACIVGSCPDLMVTAAHETLGRPITASAGNPYGDGAAAGRIVAAMLGEPFAAFGSCASTQDSAPLQLAG